MFFATYKNTVKNLFRSVTFWLATFIFSLIVLPNMAGSFQTSGLVDEFEYAQYISNLICAGTLIYPLPVFTVTLTTLMLNRDYSDHFYEIEKATGVRPLCYIIGRLCAIATVAFLLEWILSFVCLHGYVYLKGGVAEKSLTWVLLDSTVRLTVSDLLLGLPNILFYMCLAYLFGTLFRSGIAGACAGFAHVIGFYVIHMLFRNSYSWLNYFDYFSPMPNKVRHYCRFTHIEGGEFWLQMSRYHSTIGITLFCVAFLICVSVVFTLLSWLKLRKREI